MIQQEIYLLHNLAHPRIISLLDYFCINDNNDICIVMEFASNGSLSKMIADRSNQMEFLPEHVSFPGIQSDFLHSHPSLSRDFLYFGFFLTENKKILN